MSDESKPPQIPKPIDLILSFLIAISLAGGFAAVAFLPFDTAYPDGGLRAAFGRGVLAAVVLGFAVLAWGVFVCEMWRLHLCAQRDKVSKRELPK